ncbi:MAG: CoA pyrophosphatase [Myxococcota bacterium]
MFTIEQIRQSLATHQARTLSADGKRQAAVAIVLRGSGPGPELLFIERARHEGDPWSGHMAFPGGRVESADRDSRRTAERETQEEVGLSLASAAYLGQLDDLEGRHAGRPAQMVISAHVYHLDEPARVVPNHEVQEVIWFPVAGLLEHDRQVDYPVSNGARFPGILVGRPEQHIVWGLTYRFVELLMRLLGNPIPERWIEQR